MKKLLVLAAGAVAATLLLNGVGNAAQVFQRRTTVATNLPFTSGAIQEIARVRVPAGTWVVHAKTQAVNFGAQTVVRCQILGPGGVFVDPAAATQIGSGAGLPFVAMLVNQGVIRTTALSVIRFVCFHTEGDQAGIYLDPGSSLIALGGPDLTSR